MVLPEVTSSKIVDREERAPAYLATALALTAIALTASCSSVKQPGRDLLNQSIESVSLDELVRHPERWDRKHVSTWGFALLYNTSDGPVLRLVAGNPDFDVDAGDVGRCVQPLANEVLVDLIDERIDQNALSTPRSLDTVFARLILVEGIYYASGGRVMHGWIQHSYDRAIQFSSVKLISKRICHFLPPAESGN